MKNVGRVNGRRAPGHVLINGFEIVNLNGPSDPVHGLVEGNIEPLGNAGVEPIMKCPFDLKRPFPSARRQMFR